VSGRLRGAGFWLALAALACAWFGQTAAAARSDSVTIDEFAHLPTGLYYLRSGDYSLDPINPPWTRMIAAAAVLRDLPVFSLPEAPNHWAMGYELAERNRDDYQRLYVHARMAIALLGALCGALIVAWAASLYGRAEALVAAILFTFSPSMLAHGHLVTLDMAGALGATATAWCTWWLVERPGWRRATLLGVVLAAATMLKLSAFVLVLGLLVVVAVAALRERGRPPSAWLGALLVAGCVALVALNIFYAGQGTLAPLASLRLDPDGMLSGLAAAAPWLRLPLPGPFVEGVDMILNVGAGQEPSYFLAGELSAEGWWYYHLAAFAVKTPLPLVLAAVAALLLWSSGRRNGAREYCLWIPVLVLFGANAGANSLQIGVRHVLAAYPLLMILVSPLLARPLVAALPALRAGRRELRPLAPAVVAALALAWFVGGSLAVAPRYLQYFNEIAGGPDGGHRWLIDSNIDWGQDLLRLRRWMDDHDVDHVQLAYFGRVDPAVYGIRYMPLDPRNPSGVIAVSASFLMGRPYFWLYGGRMRWVPHNTYAWLQRYQPIGRAGSMFLLRIDEQG
jgi:hypothetical protein